MAILMINPELAIAQTIGEKAVYRASDFDKVGKSRPTVYRILRQLRDLGFAEQIKGGYFTIRSCLFQPFSFWADLLPSLQAMKEARYFGLSYNENDVKVAKEILKGIVTLDYRAYELTQLQAPRLFSIYVENIAKAAKMLKANGFSEGTQGRIAVLPQTGKIENEIQRVYLDCIAYGGRSTLDAIALEVLHSEKLDPQVRGTFKTEDVLKVNEDLATQSKT